MSWLSKSLTFPSIFMLLTFSIIDQQKVEQNCKINQNYTCLNNIYKTKQRTTSLAALTSSLSPARLDKKHL